MSINPNTPSIERGTKRLRDWDEEPKELHDENIRDLVWQAYQMKNFECDQDAEKLLQRAKRLAPDHESLTRFSFKNQ